MTAQSSDFQPSNGGTPAAWAARACELAEWAWGRLVNRTDAWGAYRGEGEIGREYTCADGSKGRLGEQRTVKGRLALAVLRRHFRASDRSAIVGLYTASADNLSKGGALDIDHHGPTSTAADVNLAAALAWYDELVRLGFRPLLLDSNGRGGFHLRVLLSGLIDAERLFYFLKDLTRDHRQLGFPKAPEQFPKQPDVRRCHKRFGNWLRLPGRHHKRDFWSRVWDGRRWLDGHAAIDFLLALQGDSPELVPNVPPPAPPPPRRHQPRAGGQTGNLSDRIAAYMSRLPNLGEGQGRDDVAFRFAAFLVRDMALDAVIALDWLCLWDVRNFPPKGRECLAEILRNARDYGRRPVGCERDREAVERSPRVSVTPTKRPGHCVLRCQLEVY